MTAMRDAVNVNKFLFLIFSVQKDYYNVRFLHDGIS